LGFKLYISGVEYRFTTEFNIKEQAGASSSSSIDVSPIGDALPPVSWQSVVLKEDDVPFFFGIIQSVDTPTFVSKYSTLVYPITVLSGESIFNNRLVSESLQNKYTHQIIEYLFDNYLAEEGLTKGTITQFTRLYTNYTANRLSLGTVLSELGDAVGAVARISADKVFSFVSIGSFNVVEIPATIENIKKSETGQALRTVQFVSGASAETTAQSRSMYWVADQVDAIMPYQISTLTGATINGVVAGIGVKGVDEEDATRTFLWKYGENQIVVNANATVKPATGDLVAFSYVGFYEIEVAEENETLKNEIAALSGLSGKVEAVNVDTSITNYTDGKNTAYDLLSQNDDREETITCRCEDVVATALLNQWYFNKPEIGIVGNYVVVERTITNRYDKKNVAVKLKNKGFYSRYGTVLNKNDKQVNNLSIRPDVVIIKRSSVSEKVAMVDEISTRGCGNAVYCTDGAAYFDTMINGLTPFVVWGF
jgi:hypothetical protein